jgi:hypothetical protein
MKKKCIYIEKMKFRIYKIVYPHQNKILNQIECRKFSNKKIENKLTIHNRNKILK